MKTRKDKIEFLKGLQAGTRSIVELMPSLRLIEFWDHKDESYTNWKTGETLQEDQFEKRKRPRQLTTVIFEDYS